MSNSKVITGYDASFLLRGVEHQRVVDRYFGNSYRNLSLKQVTEFIIKNPQLAINTLAKSVSINTQTLDTSDHKEDITLIRDRYNNQHVIVTTNTQHYNLYTTSGNLKEGGHCRRAGCHKSFSHYPCGIPVFYNEITYPNGSSGSSGSSGPGLSGLEGEKFRIYFLTDLNYCSFECTLATIRDQCNYIYSRRSPYIMNAEQLLKSLFSMMYPGSELHAASSTELSKDNCGPLSDDKYYNHIYRPLYNVITPPVKMQFLRLPTQ